jgi:hypothetical protein
MEIKLSVSQEEALWLKHIMQYPMFVDNLADEEPEDKKMRRKFFEVLPSFEVLMTDEMTEILTSDRHIQDKFDYLNDLPVNEKDRIIQLILSGSEVITSKC